MFGGKRQASYVGSGDTDFALDVVGDLRISYYQTGAQDGRSLAHRGGGHSGVLDLPPGALLSPGTTGGASSGLGFGCSDVLCGDRGPAALSLEVHGIPPRERGPLAQGMPWGTRGLRRRGDAVSGWR